MYFTVFPTSITENTHSKNYQSWKDKKNTGCLSIIGRTAFSAVKLPSSSSILTSLSFMLFRVSSPVWQFHVEKISSRFSSSKTSNLSIAAWKNVNSQFWLPRNECPQKRFEQFFLSQLDISIKLSSTSIVHSTHGDDHASCSSLLLVI